MLSVIVPIYNTEKYLRKCLDSIRQQTYTDLEVLLIDDGSTDSSSLICDEYCIIDSRFKCYHIKNGGQGKARNYGLDKCKGEWIAFVDSDDWIKRDMYESMMSSAILYTADIVICGWYRDHGIKLIKQKSVTDIKIYDNSTLMYEYLNTPVITSSVCNKIYHCTLWENLRFPVITSREDMAIIYKVFANSKRAVHIKDEKYIQFVRPGSTERSIFSTSKLYSLQANRELRNFIIENYPKLQDIVTLKPAKCCVSLMGEIISTFSIKENKTIYTELYQELKIELNSVFSPKIKNSKDYKALVYIVNNQYVFRNKMYLIGCKNIIIDCLKIIYIKYLKRG